MANLDVALRLRLINGLSAPSKEAKRDLDGLRDAAQRLNSTKGGDGLARDLTRVAAAGGRADASVRRVATAGTALSASGAAAGRLGTELTGVATAGGRADASLRRLGSERAGLAGLGAVAKALAGDFDRVAAAASRAASVVPRIRLQPGANTAPWGARQGDPSSAPPSRRAPPPPPRTPRRITAEEEPRPQAAGGSTILATGATALKAVGGLYVARTAMRATVGEAIGFEKAWAEVIKKVNDAPNPEAMRQLQRTVAKTAIDLGLPRQGLAELTAEAGAAGIKFGDLERYVRLAAKASIGWDMAPRDAAQKLAEIKTAGQYTIAEMDTLADKINALGDNSAAKEADIVEMMQRAAAPAKAAGVDTDTSLAALTALRSGGMQAEIAARFFGAFTSKLATAEGGGKKAKGIAEGFEMLGLTVAKVSAGMKRDAGGTMIDILDRLAKHAEPVKVATKMMGAEWWDELARFSQSAPEFRKQLDFLKDPKNFSGSLGGNLTVQLSTTANHLERLKALTGDIGDRMGRWALPGINAGIETAIKQVDELEKRRALNDAKGGGPDALRLLKRITPLGLLTDKDEDQTVGNRATKDGATWLYRKGLDLTMGELPTEDPARQLVERAAKTKADAEEAAKKARVEAEALTARADTSKDKTVRGPLLDQARRARERAVEQDALALEVTRNAGPAGARDMTGVEFGEAAAKASIETKREIKRYEEALRSKTANVRVPGTGIITSRQGAEAELAALRKRMDSMTAGPDVVSRVPQPNFDIKGPAQQTDLRIDRAPGAATQFPMTASLSKTTFDPQPIVAGVRQAEDAAKGLQTTLKQDLSAPATESMQTYSTALQTGVASALAIVVAAAAQMKAALSFTATPTIAPRLVGPSGGSAPASAAPASSSGTASSAPRVQSAALRRGGGSGNTFTGPVHVHGVQDVAGLHREVSRQADARARDNRDSGLHDLGEYA